MITVSPECAVAPGTRFVLDGTKVPSIRQMMTIHAVRWIDAIRETTFPPVRSGRLQKRPLQKMEIIMTKIVASAFILVSALAFSVPTYAQNLNNTAALYAAQQNQVQSLWSAKERAVSSSNKD